MKNFWIRTASAAAYAILFVGSIYSGRLMGNLNAGVLIFTAFLMFVAMGGTFEFFRMVSLQGASPCKPLGYALSAAMLMVLASQALQDFVQFRISIIFCGMAFLPMAFAIVLMVQLWRHSEHPFGDAAYTVVPAFYVALPLGLMPTMHTDFNVLMMVIVMSWVNDCFAYMGGSLFGRHKMWTRHSPGKTWEGTACGFLFCVLAGVFLGPLFNTKLSVFDWAVLGVICSVIGTLGDLAESMLKRSVGLKDSGSIMPGHGGFLDRFDSLLMIMPFVFVYLVFALG